MNTEKNTRKKQFRKIFWGILLLIGAIALLIDGLGYLHIFNFWSFFLSAIAIGFLVDGILDRSFGQILFSLAFLIIFNNRLLHLEAITPWAVLGAALLGTIGLNTIFPKRPKNNHPHAFHPSGGPLPTHGREEEILSGEEIHYEVSFGSAVKYIVGRDISRVFLKSHFGNLEVYFNDATLKNNNANVFVECSFGNMDLYIPAGWSVVNNTRYSFGNVEESGFGNPNGGAALVLDGNVSFGHVEIHHI